MVLFDIDGTLLDTHGLGREAFIRGLARVTGERDELKYLSFAGNTDRNVLDQVMAVRKLRLGAEDIGRIFTASPKNCAVYCTRIRRARWPAQVISWPNYPRRALSWGW